MLVKDIQEKLNLSLISGAGGLNKEVDGVYICDLLSWVMAHAKTREAWITIQTHSNVVAVAALLDLPCIIIPENAEIDEDAISKSNAEEIPLLSSAQSGYEISCRLYELLKE